MNWSTDTTHAEWWLARLGPWTATLDDLRSVVPGGFEAVARVFHPIEAADGTIMTWTELAERNGRIPHAEMQVHTIGTPAGTAPDPATHDGPTAWEGELPPAERTILAPVLGRWTAAADDCWFGVWDGYGQLHGGRALTHTRVGWLGRWKSSDEVVSGLAPDHIVDGPRAAAPGRDYLLMNGALADIDRAADLIGDQSPNLWWPADRAWFVVSEIDFAWTYVAGPAGLIDEVIAVPGLEALVADYEHSGTVTSDRRNT